MTGTQYRLTNNSSYLIPKAKMKMIKKIEVNSDDTMVVATGGSVSTSLEKHFNYEMTDKKAKTNLIKGASRETMEIEEMQKCTLIVLSVGAYHEVVIPYVLEWKVGTKVLNTEVKEIIPGYDENHKHMQTIIKLIFKKNIITVTCFNSTQKIKIEGRGYLDFVKMVLNPFIRTKLDKSALEIIDNYNREVIAALSGKRKALSRPTRSVKYKAMAKLPCTKCDATFTSSITLMKHKRSIHTRGADESRIDISNIPIVDDLSLLEISMEDERTATTKALTLVEKVVVEKSPKKNSLFRCGNCEYSSWSESDFVKYKNTKHTEMSKPISATPAVINDCIFEMIEELTCRKCQFEAKDTEELKEHINLKHSEEMLKCSECPFETKEHTDMNVHLQTFHKMTMVDIKKMKRMEISIQCNQCDYKCKFNKQLMSHMKMKHIEPSLTTPDPCQVLKTESLPRKCPFCAIEFKTMEEIKEHLDKEHGLKETNHNNTSDLFPCNECGFVLATFNQLQKHVTSHHTQNCRYCDYKAKNNEELECHMVEEHEDIILLHSMAKHVENLSNGFEKQESFRTELCQILKSLFDNQEILDKKLSLIQKCVEIPMTVMQSSNKTPTQKTTPCPPPPTNPAPCPSTSPAPCPPSAPSVNRILMIGDSIAGQLHVKTVEYATKSKVRVARAYSSVQNDVEDEYKHAPRFPTKNFKNVIENELEKEETDVLLVQSGAVDITNLKTDGRQAHNTEYFEKQAITSATNLFNSVTNAAKDHPSIKKVVILKQTPRFDITTTTTPSLKQNLSKLYNDTLDTLAAKSDCKEKLIIGNHDLDCSGGVLLARFKDSKSGKFDGIHMYGPSGQKAYTNSVMKILSSAKLVVSIPPKYHDEFDHQNCPQARYQTRQRPGTRQGRKSVISSDNVYQYTVPTHNRFTQLGDYFPGNF